jgi:hypothetical protein
MAKIYVASSWRNQHYAEVVGRLRAAGHEVTFSIFKELL